MSFVEGVILPLAHYFKEPALSVEEETIVLVVMERGNLSLAKKDSKWRQKQLLLFQSQQRRERNFELFVVFLLVTMRIGVLGDYLPGRQFSQIGEKLVKRIEQISTVQYQSKVVIALSQESNLAEAQVGKLNKPMENSHAQPDALTAMAEAISNLKQVETAAELLKRAIASANQIQNSREQANALTTIVAAISKLNQAETRAELLKQAMASANQIQNSRDQADALTAIVAAISKLKQPEPRAKLLKQAIASANQIQNSRDQADALTAIATAISKLEKGRKVKVE